MTAVSYRVLVDWNNDGDYADANETQQVFNADGISITAGRDQPRQYSPTRVGESAWTADNRDNRFSSTLGVLGSNLKPFRPVKVQAVVGAAVTDLFTGYVDRWAVKIPQYPLIVANFDALDVLGKLAATKLYTALFTNILTSAAVSQVLTAAGYTGPTSIATGLTTLGFWWLDGQTGLDALQELATHEGGFFYVKGDGTITFENRYTRTDQLTDVDTFSSVHGVEFRSHVRDVVNKVTVTVSPRTTAGSLSDVWTAAADTVLAPNEARTITAHSSDPFSGAIVPFSGTDFTVTAGSVASVSALDRTSGQTTAFTITAGVDGATVTGLKLRANAVAALSTASWVAEDAASQTAYGLRALDVAMPYLADPNVGRDAAYYYIARYSQPVDAIDLTIKAATTDSTNTQTAQVLNRALGNRVRVTLSALGLDWSGFIETVKHKIHGERHEVTYSVERLRDQHVFTLDVDNLDSDATLGW